jgi:TatD DNase family protein
LEQIPLEDMVLETDAPYLTPVPFRGTRNESAHIPVIATKIAEIKQVPVEEVMAKTTARAVALFGV